MTFEEYVWKVCGLDIECIDFDKEEELYEKYCNSEYYNGEKGL